MTVKKSKSAPASKKSSSAKKTAAKKTAAKKSPASKTKSTVKKTGSKVSKPAGTAAKSSGSGTKPKTKKVAAPKAATPAPATDPVTPAAAPATTTAATPVAKSKTIPLNRDPRLADRTWRLNNLYHVVNKAGKVVRFRMNWAQERLHAGLHSYNNVLKARQLGISTYVALLMLDSCLFTKNFTAGIVDRTAVEAKKKLAKIKYAFEMLDFCPPRSSAQTAELAALGKRLKQKMKGIKIGTTEAKFPNGSCIYAGTSLRGGTHQLIHVSELGSVAAHNPGKAEETLTGTLNSIDHEGMIIMESTHEGGQYGVNYRLLAQAMDMVGKPLSPLDPKFWFFSWIEQPEYSLPNVTFSGNPELTAYFNSLKNEHGISLSQEQMAWYEAKARTQGYRMRQEYPTVPSEALTPIAEGTIYGNQINHLRSLGRLHAQFEPDPYAPVYAVFDKGMADYTSIWWIQPRPDGLFALLDNYTANGQPLTHYIEQLHARDAEFGRIKEVILPHDGVVRDYNGVHYYEKIEAAGYNTVLVKRTSDIWAGIDSTRTLLRYSVIHARCSQPNRLPDSRIEYIAGTDALANYRVAPVGKNGVMRNEPLHNACSHACDALRTFAEAWAAGLVSTPDQSPFNSPLARNTLGGHARRSLARRCGIIATDIKEILGD